MSQNERIVPMSPVDFERYNETLSLAILATGITYDFIIVLMDGARSVWTYQSEVLKYKQVYEVKATRYPDGDTTSRCPPEYSNFPRVLKGIGLILDDCVDDGDTMFEAENMALAAGATEVHTGVVLCKPDNLKIRGWKPTFIGWSDAPGDIYFDFPREAYKKRIEAAMRSVQVSVTESSV